MCGIIGIYSNQPNLESRANEALQTVESRGPDSQRVIFSKHGALGATRLRMVDVSGPDQPLKTKDKRFSYTIPR